MRLYYSISCPYCLRVVADWKRLGLIEGKDYELILSPFGSSSREELLRLGGKEQVPFLVDGDLNMYESDKIIAYVRVKADSGGFARN